MKIRFHHRVAALSGLLWVLAAPFSHPQAAAAVDLRVLTASIPAANLTHLDLTALDGSVDLTASSDPSLTAITISVTLDAPRLQNFRRTPPAVLSAVSIRAVTDKNIVRVGLNEAAIGNIEARWTIVVPARFSASVNVHKGAATIAGLEGGVAAEVGSGLGSERGRLFVDVPRGKLLLDMGVGTIVAHRRSADFDHADATASVGDARLFLLGHEIKTPREPGPGHRVRLDGDGPDAVRARVSVGDVALHIG